MMYLKKSLPHASLRTRSNQIWLNFHLFWIFSLLTVNFSFSQQTYRRHFIIAYDVSTPFINSENNCPAYTQALIDLFSNKPVYAYNEAYQNNLNVEKNNGLPFFDKSRDEISFFHFNIAGSEFARLRWTIVNGYDESGIVTEFNKLFLKDKHLQWTNFSSDGARTPTDYILSALSLKPTPASFTGGVSMSNFVYPLVVDKIDTSKYAEEYILIILSDFLTGSQLGNTKDLDRVKDIYSVSYATIPPENSAVSYIKKQIDYLASQYYKIDFFQYSFIPTNSKNAIGIISYKIKPKIGVLTPEDVSLFVDGELSLDQRGFQSQNFRTSETAIKFTHNKNLIPQELRLSIILPEDSSKIIFNDLIATIDEKGEWISEYTNSNKLMFFDTANLTYYLPTLKISLDSTINEKNFENLKFYYEFKTIYSVLNAQPLNFIFSTERALPIESINYSTKTTIIIMYYFLPILLIIFLLIFLIIYGKPIRLVLRIDGYLDSFEIIDYKTVGKLLTPYKAWDTQKQTVDYNIIKGSLEYKSKMYIFNWNPFIQIRFQSVSVPEGFELFLKQETGDIKEFGLGTTLLIKKAKNNTISFVVGIRQNDIIKQIVDPELVKFSIEAVINDSKFFIKTEFRETLDYNFHLGIDLRDVWVGFDPGTSGSCVAVGSSTDNIILGEDLKIKDEHNSERKIIHSVVGFDVEQDFILNGEIKESQFIYGNAAESRKTKEDKFKLFFSIKKLLGFRDIKEVIFDNNTILRVSGKDLAGLLIKGLFGDINTFFSRDEFKDGEYKRDGSFNPLRAVVAIPNNFTISKIQDMVDCIGTLNQFKEIRYVYEAEAVLFYYLSNFQKFNLGAMALYTETILVFDMGGATINATVVTTNRLETNSKSKYEIDFLGKIGYGIGGDTIDYCLSKFILSFTHEFPLLSKIDLIDNKIKLIELSFKLKTQIIANFYKQSDYLITPSTLQTFIQDTLGVSIVIDEATSEMYSYFKKLAGNFKLFDHPLFINIIYNNVRDAVKEVVELSENTRIDKIIFSGRSTLFPMIKETVVQQLKHKESKTKIIALSLEELKTAVAIGACWYGINKNSVILNNLKTNASFGFKKTLSADKTDVKFYELVEMGRSFDSSSDGIDFFKGAHNISDDFAFDGTKVNFYQVIGKDATKILAENHKHKFSKIASIRLDQITSQVAMIVNENDDVNCLVELESNRVLHEKGMVSDQEIEEANEDHYTWKVK